LAGLVSDRLLKQSGSSNAERRKPDRRDVAAVVVILATPFVGVDLADRGLFSISLACVATQWP